MPEGLQAFFEALAFSGVIAGTIAGALSGWRGWPPLRAFLGALGVALIAGAVLYAIAKLDPGGMLVTIVAGPLVAAVPTGAGFLVGRRLAQGWREK